MQIRRSRSVVDRFIFKKVEVTDKEPPETALKTDLVLLSTDVKNDQTVSTVGVQLEFSLVPAKFAVSGKISQIDYILEKEIHSEADFSAEEIQELLAPLFDVIRRLTYEVTEIIFDKPGVTLDFSPGETIIGKEVEQ